MPVDEEKTAGMTAIDALLSHRGTFTNYDFDPSLTADIEKFMETC